MSNQETIEFVRNADTKKHWKVATRVVVSRYQDNTNGRHSRQDDFTILLCEDCRLSMPVSRMQLSVLKGCRPGSHCEQCGRENGSLVGVGDWMDTERAVALGLPKELAYAGQMGEDVPRAGVRQPASRTGRRA